MVPKTESAEQERGTHAPLKIQVKLWVDELRKSGEDLILSDSEQGELCGYARNMWYSGGYAENKSEVSS